MAKQKKPDLAPEMPDNVRRRDQPDVIAPDTLPRLDEDARETAISPTEDGGVSQHPIHDDDLEDLEPDDFEEMVDEAARGGFDPTDKYEVEREAELGRRGKI
jgi:hypothetical protein